MVCNLALQLLNIQMYGTWALRNGVFPAISVNKGRHSHQQLQPPWRVSEVVSTEGTQGGKNTCHPAALRQQVFSAVSPEGTQGGKNTRHPAALRWQVFPAVSPKGTQDVKAQDTGPRWSRYMSKECFQ